MGFGRGKGFSPPRVEQWRFYASKALVITSPTVSGAAAATTVAGSTATPALTITAPTVSATAAVV